MYIWFIKKILLGTETSFDLKTDHATYGLSENAWESFTDDDFIISFKNSSYSRNTSAWGEIPTGGYIYNVVMSHNLSISKTYDDGIVSVSTQISSSTAITCVNSATINSTPECDVYLIY